MVSPQVARIDDTKRLLEQLLDRGYTQATGQVVVAIRQNSTAGAVGTRLRQFEAEAARLAEAGQRFTADNPVFRALVADVEKALRDDAALMAGAAPDVQATGIEAAGTATRELALPGLSDNQLRGVGIRWNRPDPEAVAALVDTVSTPEWAAMLGKYQGDVLGVINGVAVRGITEGWGPLRTAREMRRYATDVPVSQASTLMRTLQLTSYRRATAVHQLANADILEYQVRIASLDGRCCLACVALHGTQMPLGEVIQDHFNGRCTSVSKVRGLPLSVESGETWLGSLSEEEQRVQMGEANYGAWRAGRVQLQEFAHHFEDPVFGEMVKEQSLRGILGETAREFYI